MGSPPGWSYHSADPIPEETVRANWRSIYRRLGHVLAGVDAQASRGDALARGLEKRRVAIEYLRQNLHELRPSLPAARRPSGPRPARGPA